MKSYDKNESSKHIIDLDWNNLYEWAMNQYLPIRVFKWQTQDEIKKIDVNTIRKQNIDSCILEADPKYPEELHNLHNDYS